MHVCMRSHGWGDGLGQGCLLLLLSCWSDLGAHVGSFARWDSHGMLRLRSLARDGRFELVWVSRLGMDWGGLSAGVSEVGGIFEPHRGRSYTWF